MPHIHVMMYKGRDDETKKKLAKALQEAMMSVLKAPAEHISVSMEDTEPENWPKLVEKKVEKKNVIISSQYVKDYAK